MNTIAVAILFFEKVDQTLECIKSIQNNETKVYILNNGSSSNSFKTLKQNLSNYSNVIFFSSEINLGPGKGRNYLIQKIEEDWILFLDNDITVITKDWYRLFLNHILDKENSEFDVIIPRVFNVHENEYLIFHSFLINDYNVKGIYPTSNEVNCFPGGASCVKKSLFKKIGTYSEDLKVLEDFEISIRAIKMEIPIRCRLITDIVLHHYHKYSCKKNDLVASKVRYNSDEYINAERFIQEKYDLLYYSGWMPWVEKQKSYLFKKGIVSRLKKFIKNSIN